MKKTRIKRRKLFIVSSLIFVVIVAIFGLYRPKRSGNDGKLSKLTKIKDNAFSEGALSDNIKEQAMINPASNDKLNTDVNRNDSLQPKTIKKANYSNSRRPKVARRQAMKLTGKALIVGKSKYKSVEDIVAVDQNHEDQFSKNDILGKGHRMIFVNKSEATGLVQKSVVMNSRTKRLGLVTGVLILRFKSKDSFNNRKSFFPSQFIENHFFEGVLTSFIQSENNISTSELSTYKNNLEKLNALKSVKIEILEYEKVSK